MPIVLVFIVAIAFVRNVYSALLLFIFLIPLESFSPLAIGGNLLSVPRVLGLILFGLWILRVVIHHEKLKLPLGIWVLFFLLVAIGSTLFRSDIQPSIQRIFTLVQLAGLYVIIANEISSNTRITQVFEALLLSSVLISTLGAFKLYAISERGLWALEGYGPKEYSAYVGIAILLMFIYLFEHRKNFLLVSCGIAISTLALINTGQRGAILALAVSILVIWLFELGSSRALMIPLACVGIYFVYQIFVTRGLISNEIADRFTIENILEGGGSGRDVIWRTGIQMFENNIFQGVGFGNFEANFSRYLMLDGFAVSNLLAETDPHSDFVRIAAELGIVGLVLFLGLLFQSMINLLSLGRGIDTVKVSKYNYLRIVSLLIYMITIGSSSSFIFRKIYWLSLGLVGALLLIERVSGEQNSHKNNKFSVWYPER